MNGEQSGGGGSVTQVVAALIWDGPRFLACQRPASKKRGLLWEFVGGKVEPGETKEEALVRECREELAITVVPDGVFMTVVHEYPDMTVELTLFNARIREGEPKLLEHAALAWITADEADDYPFCPADVEILARLKREAGHLILTEAGGLRAVALLPDEPSDTVVWLHEDFVTSAGIRKRLSDSLPPGKVPVLVTSDRVDWDRDLSPWPSEGVFRGQHFTGEAGAYLTRLTEELIPAAERNLPVPPVRRFLAGYSLAGLFSLWYDGFIEFVRTHDLSSDVKALYLSLGDREKNAKNPRMAKVEEATEEIARILWEKTGLPVPFELNPGGHFRDVPERMEKAVRSLIEETED